LANSDRHSAFVLHPRRSGFWDPGLVYGDVEDPGDLVNLESLVTDERDALLGMLLFRINGYRQDELSKILKLSGEDLLAYLLAIFAQLPLYAMNFSEDVQQMALPRLLQQDKKRVRIALEKVVRFLTILIPR
jgi:hypothetical protein